MQGAYQLATELTRNRAQKERSLRDKASFHAMSESWTQMTLILTIMKLGMG